MWKILYYGLWNLVLVLPKELRILLEMLAVILLFYILWPIVKYILTGLISICTGMNFLVLGGARVILPRFGRKNRYIWDEKIGKCGNNIDALLRAKRLKLKKSGRSMFLKNKLVRIAFLIFYIAAIFPTFKLEKYIPESGIVRIYRVNEFFSNMETKLTVEIGEYPPFWLKEDDDTRQEGAEEIISHEVMEPVRLELNESTAFANIREKADIHSNSLGTVSKEDEILYQYDYEHDSERFWLKVTISSQNDLEGWISANLIKTNIVEELGLR
ncbi:MAG: SH3 domain-containing protein [Lachnospiraceae bacterium]|nr:SH3 domain-containing protein [Lachnospiraceae bacterium]